ncbi:MAG: trehalose-phosphatase [Thermomicrobiales bacterium]
MAREAPKHEASDPIENHLDHLVERCLQVLSARPSAVATDIDGTISAIAATPDLAAVVPAAKDALHILSQHLKHVAVITGRTAENAELMLGLDGIVYIGNHGLEQRWLGETRDNSAALETIEAICSALVDLEQAIAHRDLSDGVLFENKRLSASIHYRLAPRRDQIGSELAAIIERSAIDHGIRMTEGRYVFELRPAITVNKGTAALDLIEDNDLKGIVFLGDDVTDIDAFRVIRASTANGIVRGLTIAVSSPETHTLVTAEADEAVEGVDGAVMLLQRLAERVVSEENAPTPVG